MSLAQTTAIRAYAYIAQLGRDEDVEAERRCPSFRLYCTLLSFFSKKNMGANGRRNVGMNQKPC